MDPAQSLAGQTSDAPNLSDLMNSRNTLRALFDNLPIAIYIIDPHYRLVAINAVRADRAGESPKNLVGRICYSALFQRETPCIGCLVAKTLTKGLNTLRVRHDAPHRNQSTEWEISTYPIHDNEGKTVQAILLEQDVTEKRSLEADLIQSEKLAAVGQLAASVAHEINNPLTAIIANAQILRREIPDDHQDLIDSAELIEMASVRASNVVHNLLGIARKEMFEFSPIDLNESLGNALKLVQHAIINRPLRVRFNLQQNMPLLIASQDQLQGVWINLFMNAIDAIETSNGEIVVTSAYDEDAFWVTFTDNGKGITPDDLTRVFEPFYTTKATGKGTGLGLSVCKRVIQRHGGSIEVESEAGVQTRFRVRLPQQV